jgi:hypothetical protein
VLVNLAVGGDAAGEPDATTRFPSRTEVNHFRVWKDPHAAPSTLGSPLGILGAMRRPRRSSRGLRRSAPGRAWTPQLEHRELSGESDHLRWFFGDAALSRYARPARKRTATSSARVGRSHQAFGERRPEPHAVAVQLSPQTSAVPRMATTQDRPRFIDDRRPVCQQPEEEVEVLSAQRALVPAPSSAATTGLSWPAWSCTGSRTRRGTPHLNGYVRERGVGLSRGCVGRRRAGRSKTDCYRHVVSLYAAACPAVCRLLSPSSQETPR